MPQTFIFDRTNAYRSLKKKPKPDVWRRHVGYDRPISWHDYVFRSETKFLVNTMYHSSLKSWKENTSYIGAQPINVSENVEASTIGLFGEKGYRVVKQLTLYIINYANREHIPLKNIDISFDSDKELDWDYVTITLNFRASFIDSNTYLESMYPVLDNAIARYETSVQEIIRSAVFFDFTGNDDSL